MDNTFKDVRINAYPETVKLVGAGVRRNDIEIASFWGTLSRVTDTGTDGTNTIIVREEDKPEQKRILSIPADLAG